MGDLHFTDRLDEEAVRALGRLVDQVIDTPSNRHRFFADPAGAALDAGIDVTTDEKMKRVVFTLADMSPSELRLLSEFNRLLIAEGLYIDTGSRPLMVY